MCIRDRAYINQIQIYLDKKDMSVHKLRLSETATNYTEYEFSNKKFNSLKDEKMCIRDRYSGGVPQ